MSTAPRIDIDPAAFRADPYPMLAKMRKEAPIAFVPQLGSTVFTRRDDIFSQEKRIEQVAIRRACSRSAEAVSPPTESPIRPIHSRIERPRLTSRLLVRTACVCR